MKRNKKYYQKLHEINKWINLCKNNNLIRGILKSSEKPKITSLITVYNSEDYINTAVKSVQNQFFSDVEILLINDGSTDNSSEIIKSLYAEDKRIKIITNKKNRGALYSKSLGILKAMGKFIIILDSDDLFINENLFNICYNEASINDIDIIEFSGYYLYNTYLELNKTPRIPKFLKFKKNNEYIKQPDLSYFIYKKSKKNKYKLIDGLLCGKLIKGIILKMTLKIIGSNLYKQKINYGDDRIINFILFKVANSFKFIKEYGFIYNYNNKSITNFNTHINNCHDELINIMSLYNYTKNTKEIEIVAYEIVFRWNIIIFPGLDLPNYKFLMKIIKKLILNPYLSHKSKKKLRYFSFNLSEFKNLNLF